MSRNNGASSGAARSIRVGYLVGSVSRLAGGLFYSVRELARGVAAAGARPVVFAARDEFTDRDFPEWDGIDVRLFPKTGSEKFGYSAGMYRSVMEEGLDILHTQGLWMYPSIVARRWGKSTCRPYVISPRGMLDPWALRNSRFKKRVAAMAFENQHLRNATFIHALNNSEAEAVRAAGLNNRVVTIPNGAVLHDIWGTAPKGRSRRLVFLGRLHPKKGLLAFIKAWSAVERSVGLGSWILTIAGWDQDGHEHDLKTLVAKLGCEGSVEFVGPQFGDNKDGLLRSAAAFVLPSQSEGLPMAVLEAWSLGVPTLITRQCNLPEGFVAGAALELPLDSDGMKSTLSRFIATSPGDLLKMGERGRHLVERNFSWPVIGRRMYDAYFSAIDCNGSVVVES